ncbi:hypothetical protein D3C72_1983830 [compost metagenome]
MAGDDADAEVADHRLADGFAAADLQQRTHGDASVLEHGFGELAGGGAGLAHQQAMALEVLQVH